MQMRTSSAAGASAESDRLAFAHLVAFFNRKFRQMQIERQQALAMVDHDAIPFKEQGRARITRPLLTAATLVPLGTRKSSP